MSMRMSNEMRDILKDIHETRTQMSNALKNKDAQKCSELKDKLAELETLYNAAEANFIADKGRQTEPQGGAETPIYNGELFYRAISGQSLSDSESAAVAAARASYGHSYRAGALESVKESGGYTVPPDISTEIFESMRNTESVRNLVAVENVNAAEGFRIYKSGKEEKLYNTAEADEIKKINTPNYNYTKYSQKKYAAITTVSNELLSDSFLNFKNELVDWLTRCATYTENRETFYGIGGENHSEGLISTAGAFKELTPSKAADITIDYLRRVKLSISAPYRINGRWLMNSDAFAFISELKDQTGRSYIQPDPMNAEQYKLLGSEIAIYDSIDTDDDGKTVIMYGDFEKAYRMFSRADFGIAMTDVGAGAFETDSLSIRGVERLDGKIMDRNAAVIIRGIPVSPIAVTEPDKDFGVSGTITKETLSALTKTDLLAIAAEYEITGLTESSTKTAIITAIINAITPPAEESGGSGGTQDNG